MITDRSARTLVEALVAFVSLVLASTAAHAELPHQLLVQTLEPESGELDQGPGNPPAGVNFGLAVGIRNGNAFVSLPSAHPGRVAVFTQTAGGWVRTHTIVSPDAAPAADFGRSLTFRDGALIVGASTAAYVYKRVDGGWKLKQKLAPPAADNIVLFADAMKYEAGTLAISALGQGLRGSVYVFEPDPSSGNFVRRARLKPADGYDRDLFGSSVAVTTATIVIGAPGDSRPDQPLGAAYVYARTAAGQWVQRQKLVAIDELSSDGFGSAVAMDSGMILVGAPFADPEGGDTIGNPTPDGHVAQGAVYAFVPAAGRYVETLKLRPRPDELFSYRRFGEQIAMFGKFIAIASHDEFSQDQPRRSCSRIRAPARMSLRAALRKRARRRRALRSQSRTTGYWSDRHSLRAVSMGA